MEFFETVNRRRTVREWADKQVTDEQIRAMIDAGLKAPTHDHLRNWEFVVIHTDEERTTALEYVKEWAARHSPSEVQTSASLMRKMYNYAVPRQYRMLQEAPYIIIPFFKAGGGMFQPTSVSSLNPFASIWCAVENMLLAATAHAIFNGAAKQIRRRVFACWATTSACCGSKRAILRKPWRSGFTS